MDALIGELTALDHKIKQYRVPSGIPLDFRTLAEIYIRLGDGVSMLASARKCIVAASELLSKKED